MKKNILLIVLGIAIWFAFCALMVYRRLYNNRKDTYDSILPAMILSDSLQNEIGEVDHLEVPGNYNYKTEVTDSYKSIEYVYVVTKDGQRHKVRVIFTIDGIYYEVNEKIVGEQYSVLQNKSNSDIETN